MQGTRSVKEFYGIYMFVVAVAMLVVVLTTGCGKYESKEYPTPAPAPQDQAFLEIKADVDKHCAKCHNGSTHPLDFRSGPVFKGSKAKLRITNGTMPPAGGLPDDVKAKLLKYLG